MIQDSLKQKMDMYEQIYFALDEPVPLKGDLKCYPVLVKDYYKFYACYPCITMDKMTKYVKDGLLGLLKKVSNPEGIAQSYLDYLITQMKSPECGLLITSQVMLLLELVLHVLNGVYCPKCGKELRYSDILDGQDEYVKNKVEQYKQEIIEELKEKNIGIEEEFDESKFEIPDVLLNKLKSKAISEFFNEKEICPDCGEHMRDAFSIKSSGPFNTIMVKSVELTSKDFDEFVAIVPRQNILDYDGDKYIDPELKEELELKAKMKNSDYTSPTLEKLMVCVSVGTGFTLEYLKTISMRKLSYYLKVIDKKETYYALYLASMSGFVTFKLDPPHWIFSDDKKNIASELTALDSFEKKFEHVT